MKKKFWTRLTTTTLVTVLGTTSFLCLPLKGSEASDETDTAEQLGEGTTTATQSSPNLAAPFPNVASLGQVEINQGNQTSPREIATLHLHQWKYKLAVTLRVKQIPVLTFLGSEADLATIKDSDNPLDLSQVKSDAMVQAKALADRLNQLSQDDEFEAQAIAVNFDEESKSYQITIDSEELVRINHQVILPDTTNNLAADALQATNRLRRLMGNAPPLTAMVNDAPSGDSHSPQKTVATVKSRRKGMASWYGPGFHGRTTANGERYNQHGLTAAHRYLPFGTQVRVTNLNNGRSITVRINDRGPYAHGRIIDLSKGAARILGLVSSGVAPVQIEILER